VDSSTTASSREAQAEIRNTTAKSETAYAAKRGIIDKNLTSDTPDASRSVQYMLRKAGLREDQDYIEGDGLALSLANDFLENRSKTIWFHSNRMREVRGAHCERLIRNSPGETVVPRNRRLVIYRHPNQFG
jgi:hypothetical protein